MTHGRKRGVGGIGDEETEMQEEGRGGHGGAASGRGGVIAEQDRGSDETEGGGCNKAG